MLGFIYVKKVWALLLIKYGLEIINYVCVYHEKPNIPAIFLIDLPLYFFASGLLLLSLLSSDYFFNFSF